MAAHRDCGDDKQGVRSASSHGGMLPTFRRVCRFRGFGLAPPASGPIARRREVGLLALAAQREYSFGMPGPSSKPKPGDAPTDAVLRAAMNASVEPEDAGERRAVEAAKRERGLPVAGAQVTEQIAERLRNMR